MPRKTPRAFKLESSASRKKLAVRRKPYWVVVGRNLSLGYRRCRGPGSWSVRGGSRQGEWIRKLADADDLGPAAPPAVLDFWQAVAKAREFVHVEPGEAAVDGAPQSVADALDRYRRHLIAQGGDPGNEQRARHHLGPLLSRPIALLTGRDLVAWRDGLVAGRHVARQRQSPAQCGARCADRGDPGRQEDQSRGLGGRIPGAAERDEGPPQRVAERRRASDWSPPSTGAIIGLVC